MPNIEILVPKSQFENNLNSNIVHCHQTMVIIYVNAQTQNIIVTSIGVTDHRCGWLTGISCSSSLLLSKYNFQCQRQEHIYAIIGGSSVTPFQWCIVTLAGCLAFHHKPEITWKKLLHIYNHDFQRFVDDKACSY